MKLEELKESMGASRGMANVNLTKKEMADATHDMHIDKMLDKESKPEDITSEQAKAFTTGMYSIERKIDPNDDSTETQNKYEILRDNLIAKILGGKPRK